MMYVIIATLILIVFVLQYKDTNKHTDKAAFGNIRSIISLFNKGISLTGGLRATTQDVAYKNSLIVGQSGSGKSSTVLVGSLFTIARGNASIAVIDVSKEVYRVVSGFLSRFFNLFCIDFTELSDGFNPLDFCHSISDVQKIAQILIKNSGTESKADPYWSASAEMLLGIFLRYLVFHAPAEYKNLYNLVRMIQVFAAEAERIDKLIVSTNDEQLLISYKALISTPDKTLQSTISSALVAVKVFGTPEVARCTAQSTFDFANFRKEKSILFICTPLTDVNFFAPVSALLFENLFKEIMSRIPEKQECSIYCLIDEMVSIRFQNLGLVYSNIRKFRGSCMGLIQDERMLEMNFSPAEAHAIRTNSFSKVYLPGQPLATCKQLEEIIGRDATNRPIMPASAIRTAKEAIILCGNDLPYKEKMIPYYKHWRLRSRTKIPPYQQTRKIEFDMPPALPL